MRVAAVVLLCCAAALSSSSSPASAVKARAGAAQIPGLVPTPIGAGGAYHPGPGVVNGSAIRGMACVRASRRWVGVHVELFADRQVVLIPAGIGIPPSQRATAGARTAAGCSYPIRTTEPTGLIRVVAGSRATLASLFAVWSRQLGPRRLLGFRGAVRAYVDGRRVDGDPRLVQLRRHAEIVLEVGGYVPPHRGYLFPRGL